MQKIHIPKTFKNIIGRASFRPVLTRHWLELSEYASIGASALGTIVAAFSSQVAYAATPLTVALALNAANRYRVSEERERSTIAFQTSEVVEYRHHSVTPDAIIETQSLPDWLPEMKANLSELQKTCSKLEKNTLTEEDWGIMNVRLLLLKLAIEEQLTAYQDRSKDSESTESQYASLQSLVAEGLGEYKARLEELERKNQQIVKPYLLRLSNTMKQLRQNDRENAARLQAVGERVQKFQEAIVLLKKQSEQSNPEELGGRKKA